MTHTTFKKITTVASRGREFYVIYDSEGVNICGEQRHYWGIESNLFGEDGRLVREINAAEGHLSMTVKECVNSILQNIEINYIKESTGCDIMKAIEIYFSRQMA